MVSFEYMLQAAVNQTHDSCKHNTCHECITDPVLCAWCSADDLKPDERCKPANLSGWCSGSVENPKSEIHIVNDRDFTSDEDKVIQIKPQRIKIKLRVGEPKEFQFYYKTAKNYPVDLYFLIDASNTMKNISETIKNNSQEIYNSMSRLTNNVYLGLGTFIDKSRVPYQRGGVKVNGCYSFRHRLNLTSHLGNFTKALTELTFGSNYDKPEGGLEGLAQVMTCKERIAWREHSRKVIIFLTDSGFHTAGDGKWSGIVSPYDGGCYLDKDGFYFKEQEMDYPSVGMISKLAGDEQFTTLFVVKKPELQTYKTLSGAIAGALVSTLNPNAIAKKIEHFYKHISFNLLLDVKMASEDKNFFEISFSPNCSQKEDCAVAADEDKLIEGTITLQEYYEKNHIEIPIVQQGLKEYLLLDVDIISSCDCEHKNKTIPNSADCFSAGDRQCGICICHDDRSGANCACVDKKEPCIRDGLECSNNGNCICGSCSCKSGFDGPYCQYRTDGCKRDSKGVLCSGKGKCQDGQCKCDRMWLGEVCDCSQDNFPCRDTNGNECNNRGHCQCGRCKCDILPKWDVREYRGDHCNQWPCEGCHERQCRELINCVVCHDDRDRTDCLNECGDRITAVLNITEDFNSNWNVCTNVRVTFGCYTNFSYMYDEETHGIVLFVLSEKDCIESAYIYGGISLGILILTGLGTLIAWKVLVNARDRAEFERFLVRAREEDEEILNECYTPATTSYQNPMFKKLSFRFTTKPTQLLFEQH